LAARRTPTPSAEDLACCGKPKRIKDIRTKCVQTVFGAFRFRGRRYRSCACRDHPDGYRQDFPLGEIIPRRTTPEVRYLFAELGARMPYRAASRVLKTCGFGDMRASHMAIRPPSTLDAESPVFKNQRLISLEFSSVNLPQSSRRTRLTKSVGRRARNPQFGTFDINCTGRPSSRAPPVLATGVKRHPDLTPSRHEELTPSMV